MNKQSYIDLVSEVKAHDYHYFIENSPVISDTDYDKLYFRIQQIEEQHPEWIVPDSPTQFAHGEKKNGHLQIRRRTPMLSTEKAQSIAAVEKWCKRTMKAGCEDLYTVEWKYDGVSCSLVYIDGILTEASYGKGIEGNDCMATAKLAQGVPARIAPLSHRIEVRGEMVVSFANFEQVEGYKNCRSAAQGILADTNTAIAHLLEFHPYEVNGIETPSMSLGHAPNNSDLLNNLSGFSFSGGVLAIVSKNDLAGLIEELTAQRDSLAYPTDGLVIKVYNVSMWESLGATEHHNHYAIAYKFAPSFTAETVCTSITHTVGATGKVTYIAHFSPVVLNGGDYDHASCGTQKSLQKKGIAVGARLLVGLSNDVTIQVLQVLSEGTAEAPVSAPSIVGAAPYSEPAESPVSDNSDEDLLNIIDNALNEEEPTTVPEDSPSGATKLLCGALALVAMVGLATVGLGLAAFGIPVLGGFLLKA